MSTLIASAFEQALVRPFTEQLRQSLTPFATLAIDQAQEFPGFQVIEEPIRVENTRARYSVWNIDDQIVCAKHDADAVLGHVTIGVERGRWRSSAESVS